MKRILPIIALLGMTTFVLAQNTSTPAQAGSTPQQQTDATNTQQSARSFDGKIQKSGGKLVLQESSTQTAYQLDDQDKAKQFEGKNVKVMATVDPNTNTLHVVDITASESR
jgi:hypothetical protein